MLSTYLPIFYCQKIKLSGVYHRVHQSSYLIKNTPQRWCAFSWRDLLTGSYVSLCSKYGQRFLAIATIANPDTVNGGHWYTLKVKLGDSIGVSYYLILITTQSEVKFCINYRMHLHLPTKPPIHPCKPATNPGFVPIHGVLPNFFWSIYHL